MIRVRMGQHDAHYGGNLVDGARILELFGDVATEILIGWDGDEGLFRAYTSVDFLAPVYAGDFIEARAKLIKVGKTSRTIRFEAWKDISQQPDVSDSAADRIEPVLVCKAIGVCVVPLEKQR